MSFNSGNLKRSAGLDLVDCRRTLLMNESKLGSSQTHCAFEASPQLLCPILLPHDFSVDRNERTLIRL